jgi:hypothetical protein
MSTAVAAFGSFSTIAITAAVDESAALAVAMTIIIVIAVGAVGRLATITVAITVAIAEIAFWLLAASAAGY